MDRVVIRGADGFVGYYVTRKFVEAGWDVQALIRSEPRRIKGLLDEDRIRTDSVLLGQADLAVDLGWTGASGDRRKDFDLQYCNARNNLLFLRYCKDNLNVKRYVSIGTIMERELEHAIHGPAAPDSAYTYAVGKQLAHNLCKLECVANGVEYVCPVITNAFGPMEYSPRLVNTTIRKLLSGVTPEFSSATQNYDFVYVEDVANAIFLAATKGVPMKEYVIGSDRPQPLKGFLEVLCNTVDPDIRPVFGNVPFTGVNMPLSAFDNSELRKDTGWKQAVPFEEAIRLTTDWIKQNDK